VAKTCPGIVRTHHKKVKDLENEFNFDV